MRLLRGGSGGFSPRNCRSAYRGRSESGNDFGNSGFRVVCLPDSCAPSP